MPTNQERKMGLNRLQKRILIILIILCLVTPAGILLPMFFNAGDAWGEWSAQTIKDLIGYVPQGLAKYSDAWKAPLTDYTLNAGDKSVIHQSGFYLVSGIIGATLTYVVMLIISKIIIRNEK
jgi:cobalt/nickel transport protein